MSDSSPRNALHFHLHISLDDSSQDMSSPLFEKIQGGLHESENLLQIKQAENSFDAGEKASQSKMDRATGLMGLLPPNLDPKTSENDHLRNLNMNKDSRRLFEEKLHIENLEVADDVNAAVELSIAASEALAIHEIVKSGPLSEDLPAATVLEVALRVKEARLEGFEASSHCLGEEADEIDFLLDLDESSLEEAFEDVGLSVSGSDNLLVSSSIISEVEDTPVPINPYGCGDKVTNVLSNSQGNIFDNIYMKNRLDNELVMDIASQNCLSPEICVSKGPEKLCDEQSLPLESSCHANGSLHASIQAGPGIATSQGVDLITGSLTSFQPQGNPNSYHFAASSENSGQEHEVDTLVPNRFISRWLGGWTGKEVDGTACRWLNNSRSIPKFFVTETSFLSESADIAPDENSFVQEQATGSESCIPSDGLCYRANERLLVSPEAANSADISLSDPLCSFVPCSLTSENACLNQPQNQNQGEVHAEKGFCTIFEVAKENRNVQFVHEDAQSSPKINVKSSGATVCKRLTSLKAYSRLLPSCGGIREEGIDHCQRPPSSEHHLELLSGKNCGCSVSSKEKNTADFSPFTPLSKCSACRINKENYETQFSGPVFSHLTNKERCFDDNLKDGADFQISEEDGAELQVHPLMEMNAPFNLNNRVHRRLQASRTSIILSTEKNNLLAEASVADFQQRQMPHKLQSGCADPHGIQVSGRKRVRFSDEVELQQNNNLQKSQCAQQNRSTAKAGKKLRDSSKQAGSRTQKVKTCFKNYLSEDVKRLILYGLSFLLTGFCGPKEKEIEGLIRRYGGIVLYDIPSPPSASSTRKSRSSGHQQPIVLCIKELQTTKFLYGCAVDTFILKIDWLTESIAAGSLLPPEKYLILSHQHHLRYARIGKPVRRKHHKCIFDRVGIMLHGKHSFCTKIAQLFKHGGGQVFKTLQWLVQSLDNKKNSVGAIVTENESTTSRHLRCCASVRKIPMMPDSWIINSLYLGKLLPFPVNHSRTSTTSEGPAFQVPMELSEEI